MSWKIFPITERKILLRKWTVILIVRRRKEKRLVANVGKYYVGCLEVK